MKLNFIKDKEANLEKNDLLGTKPYVNTLLEVIKKADAPFTIGLFGGWGTGKSSIIKTIEEKYNEDQSSRTKVFVYDAWKYSKDSFRRTFILKIKETFNLEEGEEYQNFYSDEHRDIDHEIKPKKGFWSKLIVFSPLLLFLVWLPFIDITFDSKVALTIISIFLTPFTYLVKEAFVEYKISITKPKTFAPEQFENAFIDAIQKITKPKLLKKVGNWFKTTENKTIFANRLVIVIDNIDRCHKELAFELLLTVKTFLEQKDKEIIFILPIDENEIKKHISTRGHDGNEFLRKLFNTTLTIKKFSEDDLFEFTKGLQKKHKLELSDDVLSIISQEFSRSPRKIIQFLNVLQTEFKLAEEQEKKDSNNTSNFKKGYITENIEFLVKILLIRGEWTHLYDKIKENPFLLDDINGKIDSGVEKVVYGKDVEDKDISLTDEQKRFFESTRYISATNVEAFFSNKDAFPDFPDDLPKLVLAQDWETVKTKYLEKNIFEFNKFLFFIDTLFKREVTQRKLKRSSFNIFSFLFKITEDKKYKEELLRCFYSSGKPLLDIKSKLNGKDVTNIILNFNPKLLLIFVKTDLSKNSRLLQNIINVINNKENDDEDHYDLLTKFINELQKSEEQLKKVGTRFSEILKEHPDVFDDFKGVLADAVVAGALIQPSLLEEFIKNLEQNSDAENIEMKVKIINQYNSSKGLNTELLKQYIERIIEFLSGNNITTDTFWLEQLIPLVKNIKEESIKTSVFNMLTQKNTFLWQQYNAQWNQEAYQECLYNFLIAANEYYILSKASQSEIETWLNNFFSKNESSELGIKINKLYKKTVNHFLVFDWAFSDQIISKFNQLAEWEDKTEIAETLNLMLSKTTDEKGLSESQIQNILNNYINYISTNEEAVQSWLTSAIKNSIVKSQLAKVISELDTNKKLNILNVIKKLDKNLLKDSVEEIISETGIANLEENFKKLDNSQASLTLINSGIEKTVKNLQQEEDQDYFKKFLTFIGNRDKLPESVRVAMVNKVSSFLSNEKIKEEKLFALETLNKITIPKSERELIDPLLKRLEVNDFKDEEKALFTKVKKKK
jgi:hypothetical protein